MIFRESENVELKAIVVDDVNIDEERNEMMDRLVGQMAKIEGVTEQLKSDDWIG